MHTHSLPPPLGVLPAWLLLPGKPGVLCRCCFRGAGGRVADGQPCVITAVAGSWPYVQGEAMDEAGYPEQHWSSLAKSNSALEGKRATSGLLAPPQADGERSARLRYPGPPYPVPPAALAVRAQSLFHTVRDQGGTSPPTEAMKGTSFPFGQKRKASANCAGSAQRRRLRGGPWGNRNRNTTIFFITDGKVGGVMRKGGPSRGKMSSIGNRPQASGGAQKGAATGDSAGAHEKAAEAKAKKAADKLAAARMPKACNLGKQLEMAGGAEDEDEADDEAQDDEEGDGDDEEDARQQQQKQQEQELTGVPATPARGALESVQLNIAPNAVGGERKEEKEQEGCRFGVTQGPSRGDIALARDAVAGGTVQVVTAPAVAANASDARDVCMSDVQSRLCGRMVKG